LRLELAGQGSPVYLVRFDRFADAAMVRNGLYHITVEMLDGVKAATRA